MSRERVAGRDVVIELDVSLRTRDGTVLRGDVYRPADAGRHPVLLGRTTYGKSTWGRLPGSPAGPSQRS